MNLPLPSAPTSAAPGATRYAPACASASSAVDAGDATAFANLLANAAQSADSRSSQRSTTAGFLRSSADSQSPAAQVSDRAGARQEGSDRRSRLKTQKTDANGSGIKGDAVAAQISCSAAAAPSLSASSDALSASESDEVLSPAETSGSNPRFSQPSSDTGSARDVSDGTPVGQDSDGPDDASSAPEAVGDAGSPGTAIDGFPCPGQTPPPVTKSAHTASMADPAAQDATAVPQHPDDSAVSTRLISASSGNLTSAPAASLLSATAESPSNQEEKIAPSWTPPTGVQTPRVAKATKGAASFTSLTSDSQQVETTSGLVGIASAKSSTDMRKLAATSTSAGSDRTSGADVPASVPPSLTSGGTLTSAPVANIATEHASTPVSHSAAAVEATLDAVEHMRDAAHSSVELNLSFSDDARLSVRVELRNDIVHTTFRTDSSELRQALSSEWRVQAPTVAAISSDHPVRIADPVFATASGSTQSTGTSTGGYADSRKTPESSPAESSPASPRRQQSQAASAASLPSGQPRLPTSLRLNVFA